MLYVIDIGYEVWGEIMVNTIDYEQLDGDYILVDVRSPKEY